MKTKLGSKPLLFPHPVALVGADVDGKPNYMTIAFIGVVNMNPGMIAFGGNRKHHTNRGILANKTFSVNIPSEAMLEAADYVGLNSGEKTDKSGLFEAFYGVLKNAPMITECPISMECKLLQTLDLGGLDTIFIGEIVETYADESVLTAGNPDIAKVKPFVFSMSDNRYHAVGRPLGKAWSIGKDYKPGGKARKAEASRTTQITTTVTVTTPEGTHTTTSTTKDPPD
jgi:flavin reductase (DIM6/NTAB) family NADH-FMN oxidoreductase RutF